MATAQTKRADDVGANAATPPPRPAPMPTQEFVFWTPRLAMTLALQQFRLARGISRLRGEH